MKSPPLFNSFIVLGLAAVAIAPYPLWSGGPAGTPHFDQEPRIQQCHYSSVFHEVAGILLVAGQIHQNDFLNRASRVFQSMASTALAKSEPIGHETLPALSLHKSAPLEGHHPNHPNPLNAEEKAIADLHRGAAYNIAAYCLQSSAKEDRAFANSHTNLANKASIAAIPLARSTHQGEEALRLQSAWVKEALANHFRHKAAQAHAGLPHEQQEYLPAFAYHLAMYAYDSVQLGHDFHAA